LHNAVVAWNMVHIEPVVEQLLRRPDGGRKPALLTNRAG
jgi:hypothetical protein